MEGMKLASVSGTVTNAGKEYILDLLSKEVVAPIRGLTHIAIGTATPVNEKLGGEVARRAILEAIDQGKTATYSAIFEEMCPDTDVNITEVAVLGNASVEVNGAGVYVAVKTLAPVNKRAGVDILRVNFTLYFE